MHWWRSFFRRPAEGSLNSELSFHIDKLTEANVAAGMSLDEARRRAILEFGGHEQVKEECRDVHRIATIENTLANLKQAWRFIRKSPSFSLTVAVTLALGIGANTAVFSAVDAILFRPLPFPNSGRLVLFHQEDRTSKAPETRVATVRIEDWNRMNSTFQAISGYYTDDTTETSTSLPEKVTVAYVAPRFLQVWGVSPSMGRDFTPQEEHFGGPNAIIITDGFWRRMFHADPHVIGKRLRITSWVFTVVGVMPASFLFPDRSVELWTPNPIDAPYAQDRASTWFLVFGRLKPGVTIPQARANLANVQAQLARQFPKTDKNLVVDIESLKESTVGGVRRSLSILFGAVSLLLLIACTNIAALLLARTAQREREIAIRYSLGASRASVVVQLLTESFVLAIIGSLAGLALAAALSSVFRSLAKSLPRVDEITLDWRLLVYSLACGVIATLLFGLIPALQGSRRNVAGRLARRSRVQVSSVTSLQWILVGTQVALAVTLLVGAGLLLRTFQELGRVSPGFDPHHVLSFHISGSYAETADLKKLNQSINRTLDALRTLPGVEAVADSEFLPGWSSKYPQQYELLDSQLPPDTKILPDAKFASPGYLSVMRIPLLAGEFCTDTNWQTAVVNSSFANAYLNGSSPIGHHIQPVGRPYDEHAKRIVGVVGDAREDGISNEPIPTLYNCGNAPDPNRWYLIRTYGDPLSLASAVRRKIHQIDPNRSVYDFMPLEERLFDSLAENRFRTLLLTLFALTAISLACVGIYGTLSYFVTVQTREVGLRIALGAVPGQILRAFLSRGLSVSMLGCIAGLALASALSRVLGGMLYGVSRVDAVTYTVIPAMVLIVAAFSSFVPAARAAWLDPMRVLRDE